MSFWIFWLYLRSSRIVSAHLLLALSWKKLMMIMMKVHGVHYYHCDVTDTDAVVATCEDIRKTHGNPTVLINNAGIANAKTILQVRFAY